MFLQVKLKSLSHVRLCGPMDCSLLGSSILQARILEWIAIFFSRGSSWSRDQAYISCIGRWVHYHWVIRIQLCIWLYINIVSYIHSYVYDCFPEGFNIILLWTGCLCLLKFICWNSSPQCDDVRRWGLWKAIRMGPAKAGSVPLF